MNWAGGKDPGSSASAAQRCATQLRNYFPRQFKSSDSVFFYWSACGGVSTFAATLQTKSAHLRHSTPFYRVPRPNGRRASNLE